MDAIYIGSGNDRTRIYQRSIESSAEESGKRDMKVERSSGLRDSVEISDTAYRMLKDSGELKATSGKDELRITRGR